MQVMGRADVHDVGPLLVQQAQIIAIFRGGKILQLLRVRIADGAKRFALRAQNFGVNTSDDAQPDDRRPHFSLLP